MDHGFDAAVAHLLAAGMHAKRGMSQEAYTDVCHGKWTACVTDDVCRLKILTDSLLPRGALVEAGDYEFVDGPTRRLVESQPALAGDETGISCKAVGLLGSDLKPISKEEAGRSPLHETARAFPELHILALFDVLGFENRLQRDGLEKIQCDYEGLIERAVLRDSMRCLGRIRIDAAFHPALFALPVRYAYFSDTILLWVPLDQMYVMPFLARCADLLCEALKVGIALRGGISAGEAVLHRPSSTYLGLPLVEAARLEAAQEWLGVSLGRTTLDSSEFVDGLEPELVVPFDAPSKANKRDLYSGLVLNWPTRARTRHGLGCDELRRTIAALNVDSRFSKYYLNALLLVDHINSDSFVLPSASVDPDEFAEAVLRIRREEAAPSPDDVRLFQKLRDAGEPFAFAAEFGLALARNADELPPIPPSLPTDMAEFLRRMQAVAEGDGVHVAAIVRVALEARHAGRQLTDGEEAELDLVAEAGDPTVAEFLRAVASRAPLPELSAETPAPLASRLASVRRLLARTDDFVFSLGCEAKTYEGDLRGLVFTAVEARRSGNPLDGESMESLRSLAGVGESDAALAQLISDVVSGAALAVSSDAPQEFIAFSQMLSALIEGSQSVVDFAALAMIALEARREGGDLSTCARFLYDRAREAGHPYDRTVAFLEEVVAQPHLPPIPADLDETTAAALSEVRALAAAVPFGANVSRLSDAVLNARRNQTQLSGATQSVIDAMITQGFPASEVALFMQSVADGGALRTIDEALPTHIRESLEILRRRALRPDRDATILVNQAP